MQVTDIEISDYRYCPQTARHQARVHLMMGDRHVNLMCQVNLPTGQNASARRAAFVAEAARQMRRMPEFRSGRRTLEFPDALLQSAPATA